MPSFQRGLTQLSRTAFTAVHAAGARLAGATRRVSGSAPKPALPLPPPTLVIVGNGMIGFKLCEQLVALRGHEAFRVVVFGDEPLPAYDRIHLTDLFSGRDPASLALAPAEWYQRHGIELHVGKRVTAIDRERCTVRTAGGLEVAYDRLVLATGSRAFVPPLEGADLPGVFVYRTLEDWRAIRDAASQAERAAVLGGGLLGLEAAKALHDAGLETHIIEHGSSLLARQLGPAGAALLKRQVEGLGLNIRLNSETQRIVRMGKRHVLTFNHGEGLAVDLVVLAAGIRPRDELARACGLKPGPRGGIEIDDRLQTSDPRIYAIGECACHQGVIYGLAAPGYKMAHVLAQNLLGKRARFEGDDLSAKLKLMGVAVTTLGDFQGDGSTVRVEREDVFRELVLRRGRLVGATAVGDWPELSRVQEAIDGQRRLWPWQLNRFRREGRIWPEVVVAHVSQWPASALVCNCMRVNRGTLTKALARPEGATMEALVCATGASTVCGSCRPLLADLLGEKASLAPANGWRGLLIASAAALIGVLLIYFLKPWPFAESVQGGWSIDQLWRSGTLKQVTGFTLLGLMLLSLGLSLRKRLRRLTLGDYGWWRLAHAVLGATALVALISHTGFRLGHQLNAVLMMNVLALILLGGLAGGLTALEARWHGPGARRLRHLWTIAHILLFWPLPALVAFHVLKVYYY